MSEDRTTVEAQEFQEISEKAGRAADYLKLLASEHRLMILCKLIENERSVGELVAELGLNQPNVSQHLAKLRALNIVAARRDGPVMRYRLVDETVRPIISALYGRFCEDLGKSPKERE